MIIELFTIAEIRWCFAANRNPAMLLLQLMSCGFVSNPSMAARQASEHGMVPKVSEPAKADQPL